MIGLMRWLGLFTVVWDGGTRNQRAPLPSHGGSAAAARERHRGGGSPRYGETTSAAAGSPRTVPRLRCSRCHRRQGPAAGYARLRLVRTFMQVGQEHPARMLSRHLQPPCRVPLGVPVQARSDTRSHIVPVRIRPPEFPGPRS